MQIDFNHRAFIVDAVRTPIAKYKGALKDVRPDNLVVYVIQAMSREILL